MSERRDSLISILSIHNWPRRIGCLGNPGRQCLSHSSRLRTARDAQRFNHMKWSRLPQVGNLVFLQISLPRQTVAGTLYACKLKPLGKFQVQAGFIEPVGVAVTTPVCDPACPSASPINPAKTTKSVRHARDGILSSWSDVGVRETEIIGTQRLWAVTGPI